MTTIIAERDDAKHWNAWTEDYPCLSFGGETAAEAVTCLCEAHDIDPATLACRYSQATRDRLEFFETNGPCPDCKGQGIYTGLNTVEDCPTCCGGGRV